MIDQFLADENGATAVEYGMIAALIAVTIIAVLSALGINLNKRFSNISSVVE